MAPPAALRWSILCVSVITYILCGTYNHMSVPWSVGSTFGPSQMANDHLDAFEVLLLLCWCLVFCANGYLVYVDSHRVYLSIAYILSFVQYVLVVTLTRYFGSDTDSRLVTYAPYWSATALIVVFVTVFTMNRYLMPSASKTYNGVCCAIFALWYLLIYLFETLHGSIYGDKMASKLTLLFLFFGAAVFMARFASMAQAMQKREHVYVHSHSRIDQELRRMRETIDLTNGVAEHQSSSDECEPEYHHETCAPKWAADNQRFEHRGRKQSAEEMADSLPLPTSPPLIAMRRRESNGSVLSIESMYFVNEEHKMESGRENYTSDTMRYDDIAYML